MRIGVLGSMVWDRIDHPEVEPVERWGGIAYSLAAASAALPDGWAIRPIVRVGRDLADRARSFFDGLPGLERPGGVRVVDEPNNRVQLRYTDRQHRTELLSGGVGGWEWSALRDELDGLDAVYVNLISGFELDLGIAGRLRTAVRGPLYADLHSLLLGVAADGRRVPRRLAHRDDWLDAFDMVQVNQQELSLVAGDDDPHAVAEAAVRRGVTVLFVTRGPDGASWTAVTDAPRPWEWPAGVPREAIRTELVPVEEAPDAGDPTGCGDVWGATCFLALLEGRRLSEAARAANRAAARNVDHRGAEGLRDHLRSDA